MNPTDQNTPPNPEPPTPVATSPSPSPQVTVGGVDNAPGPVFQPSPINPEGPQKNRRNWIIAIAVIVILIIGGIVTALLAKSDKSDTDNATTNKNHSQSADKTSESVNSSDDELADPVETKQFSPFPDQTRSTYISYCTGLGNTAVSCTCDIDWIQQHYTVDEFNSINGNKDSRAYEDMVLGAYDDGSCKIQ